MKKHKQQSGFTLVESLIAMLVIVIGILGVAAVQSAGISSTKISSDRSVASIHTSALLSRMNANNAYWQTIPDDFDIEVDATGAISDLGAGSDGADLEAENTDCSSGVCSPIEAAAYNLKTWAQNGSSLGGSGGFADRLPAPAARIRRIGNDFPVMLEITLTWNETRSVAGMPMSAGYYTPGNTPASNNRNVSYVVRARP
ncbi:MAG TPA: type IV pilus modification protein PilV [Woeseiaceae bacterium]|nr:type IV pilus modification protein PilV [Woeseiaceae bacterium]